MKNITAKDFRDYLEVQLSGKYNMFDPMAIYSTGLDKETYRNIQINYKELIEKYKEDVECKKLLQRLGHL